MEDTVDDLAIPLEESENKSEGEDSSAPKNHLTSLDIPGDSAQEDDTDGAIDAPSDSTNVDASRSSEAATNPSSTPAPVPTIFVPSLRGRLFADSHVCRGVWALSDAAHDYPEQTSDFEFKLVKALNAADTSFPRNGKYQGWFSLKQLPPLKPSIKIDDKEMNMRFTKNEDDGGFKIEGEGSNKFGKFSLNGKMLEDGSVQMYRVYVAKPLVAKKPVAPTGTTPTAKKRGANEKKVTIADEESPRDSSRIRKRASFGSGFDFDESNLAASTGPVVTPVAAASTPRPAALQVPVTPRGGEVPPSSGRTPRMSQHMQKCSELLKEIMKQPQSIYFAEPVDHVKFNIPDYPILITEPMDFGTIRQHLDRGSYHNPEAFAEHMRLVFRNALTYNQLKDHPVHIAAKDISGKFEEKFRILLSQMGQASVYESSAVVGTLANGGMAKKAKGQSGQGRPSSTGGVGFSKMSRSSSAGQRGGSDMYVPPPLDSGAHHLAEMQRRMEEMHNEIMRLRTEVKQGVRTGDPYLDNLAPLTFDEKKTLITEISKLPVPKMMQVVEIIRSVIPQDASKDNGDEIEIPLDELDTGTLRRLQKFVADAAAEKKKRAPASRQSGGGRGESAVKRKKSNGAAASPVVGGGGAGGADLVPAGYPQTQQQHGGGGPGRFDDGDADFLFSPESFDDMRAAAAANGLGLDSDEESDQSASGRKKSQARMMNQVHEVSFV